MEKLYLKTIGERLQQYLSYKKIGINKFGTMTNTSGAQISNILKGKNYGITKLINILEACPELNLIWLLKGEGLMIVDENLSTSLLPLQTVSKGHSNHSLISVLQENSQLKEELSKLQSKFTSLESVITYQEMTIETYKSSLDILSANIQDLRDIIQHYKSLLQHTGTQDRKTA